MHHSHRWLTLPHPGISERAFVLRPLLDIAPRWLHPALKLSARTMLKRVKRRPDGAVMKMIPEPLGEAGCGGAPDFPLP
jgi:7,8-dihydro-6-hydroxymethylpterin-pyrophosphokinase